MNSINVSLNQHEFDDGTKLFSDDTLELKNINFIFAKNGTGKSTLTQVIQRQFKEQYDVRVFSGFSSVLSEGNLNSVVLGQENIEIQAKVREQDNLLKVQHDRLNMLLSDLQKLNQNFQKLQKDFESQNTKAASQIKNTLKIPNYKSPNFKQDSLVAKKLNKDQVRLLEMKLSEKPKQPIDLLSHTGIVPSRFLDAVNEVTESVIEKPENLSGVETPEKEQFARNGMHIHSHKEKEVCAFCGSLISDQRWESLSNYFSNEFQNLEKRIKIGNDSITRSIENIQSYSLPVISMFYVDFVEEAESIISAIKLAQSEYVLYLSELKTFLDEKSLNITSGFTRIPTSEITQNFDMLIEELNVLIGKNNLYAKNIEMEHAEAEKSLRLNLVAEYKETMNLENQENELNQLRKITAEKQQEITEQNKKIQEMDQKKQKLLEQTKDERLLATQISDKLAFSGHYDIRLVYSEEGNKGIYTVQSSSGKVRSIHQLSTGEKNIIAFLYFLGKLKQDNEQRQLIIFDDPMNSNDDGMQYMIIAELKQLLKNLDNNIALILTHNNHFYINVRYGFTSYKKNSFYHMKKVDGKSKFTKIDTKEQDFQTNYSELWQELHYMYDLDKPAYMINTIRRILETYSKFNSISDDEFYKFSEEGRKLFNVNSHSIDDLQADLNGKTREDIMCMLRNIFTDNGGELHFKAYWQDEECL